MIVEDETIIRFNVVDELEDAGYEVFEAANADDAIAILAITPRIRLLFTDIAMPGTMDGLKLATAVRHRWPPIKISSRPGTAWWRSPICLMAACFSASRMHTRPCFNRCRHCCQTRRRRVDARYRYQNQGEKS